MAVKYLSSIDLNKNELQNAKVHVLASAPSNPQEGQIYYNSTDNKLFFYDGSAFVDASSRRSIDQWLQSRKKLWIFGILFSPLR